MLQGHTLRSRLGLWLALVVLASSPALMSCHKVTDEQKKTIADLDQQRAGLQSDLARAQNDQRAAEGKLASAQRDLADCQADTKAVQDGLSRWPNVWADSADWRVAPPPPPVPEKPMKGKKAKPHAGGAMMMKKTGN